MCYTGGPRCSSHVGEQLEKARYAFYAANTEEERAQAHSNLKKLEMEMNSTPNGQKALKAEVDALRKEGDFHEAESLETILTAATSLREHDMKEREKRLAGNAKLGRDCKKDAESSIEQERILAQNKKYNIVTDDNNAKEKTIKANSVDSVLKQQQESVSRLNEDRNARGLPPVEVSDPVVFTDSVYSSYDNSLIPQAPDLEKISSVVDSIDSGATTAAYIGESLDMTARDGSYYGNGAEYLGLVQKTEMDDNTNEYTLTTNGELFKNSNSVERVELLKELVNSTPLMKFYHENDKDRELLEEHISEVGGYQESVAKRRASSLITWDSKLNNTSFAVSMDRTMETTKVLALSAAEKQRIESADRKAKLSKPMERSFGFCHSCFMALPATGVCSECD